MRELAFRILNVFTVDGGRLTGNPLAVFEDGSGLSDETMMALARQLNLSETTFILPSTVAGAARRVRIFTPTLEMPFAGHPTLGTAHVVRDLAGTGDTFTLEMKAGLVEVVAEGDRFMLKTAREPETRVPTGSQADIAAMLCLPPDALAGPPLWVDTGAEQLVIPLRSTDLVVRARPNADVLASLGFSERRGESMAYVWARDDAGGVLARFFFLVHDGVVEDPATGSACANLGGYLIATDHPLPLRLQVSQGEAIGRPSRLHLHVDADRGVFVSGDVIELGRGRLRL